MNYKELSEQAGSLRKAKQLKQALPLFEDLYSNYREQLNTFDWWGYAYCLLHLDRYKEALDISHQGLKKFPESEYLKNTYTWAIYYLHIQPEPVKDRSTFFKAAQAILRYSDAENIYSPFANTIFSVIDLMEQNYDQQVDQILEWVKKLNPSLLDKKSYSFTKPDGKMVEKASHYEKYYAVLVKALYESGNYEECIIRADEAMATITKFHNNYQIWIPRNKALALHKLERHQECVDILGKLFTKKPEWYICADMAVACEAMNDAEKAFKLAIEAVKMSGPAEMKINLYKLLSRLFSSKAQHREALIHVMYVNHIREKKGWTHDEEATALMNELQAHLPAMPGNTDLSKEIRAIWEAHSPRVPRQKGKIKRILPNGNAGFVTGDDRKDYYFSVRDFNGNRNLLVEGFAISFKLAESFDAKKQQASVKAVDIKKA